uniref:Retinaldehyde binding protein n=1 Tax=Echinococcus granulosus TaxID=6210 RepID=A0A068WLX1_ECHGR|nr:retinaldehyde binding protein [Echinococcus granulosus]
MSSSKSSAKATNLEVTNPEEFHRLLTKFRETMVKNCKPLPDEPDFFVDDIIMTDFLRARKYKLDEAVAMLTSAVEWRREYQPLKADCQYCHDQPGYHCIRQVGHDKIGRPILYACFAQAFATKNHSVDTIMHCVQMLENARHSFKQSATQVVFIIDCMTLPCCNPNLGKKMASVFSNYYPERLGAAVIVNHKAIFQSIWRTIRKFLDPVTARKVIFLKQKTSQKHSSNPEKKSKRLSEGLRELCDEATAQWLETEIQMNREINENQMRFWEKPSGGAHDPRGTEAFVREFIDCGNPPNGFMPHPNIVDMVCGKLAPGYPVHLRKGGAGDKFDKEQMKEYGIDSVDADDDEDED